MTTALLLIDFQNDYFPNGRMPLEKSVEVAAKAQEMLQAFRNKQLPVIHVQHISTRPDAVHFLPCTKGVEFYSQLSPLKNETVIKKHYPNSFKDTSLANHLHKNQITHIVFCGMMTHLCVDATVRAACDAGFTCTVLHDACTTRNLEFSGMVIPSQTVHHAFLAAMNPLYAQVTGTRDFLQKLATKASMAI